ncbi:response regulator [Haloparvum sp. PAK95]|uniref:response regulator n=1 Tax=Haloparvum sp. PAK95 TaxID=3418962 RepID=UPI003D2F2712
MSDATPASVDTPTVQIVEDESKIAELYRMHLPDSYDVRVEATGKAALERLDDAVDVLLVDRRMPGLSGDEFVRTVRERGHDCAIAMVSAIDPDLDVVSTAFEAYLVKPLSGERLRRMVEELTTIREHDEAVRNQYALLQQLATLKRSGSRRDLRTNEAYTELLDDLRRRRAAASTRVEPLVGSTFELVLEDLPNEQPSS